MARKTKETRQERKARKAVEKRYGPPFWKKVLSILSPVSSILGIILIQIPPVTVVYGALGILLAVLCGRGLEDKWQKQQHAGFALGIITVFVALYKMF